MRHPCMIVAVFLRLTNILIPMLQHISASIFTTCILGEAQSLNESV